ncbi:uncharacterized protein LOC111399999 [Olea europaea var. sylvestris]|uniref:uncharacterized protein LOC111399999 n=1 Tax=Olea europaea var. sylvestris TaxID=158386 RepID=UPI000C1CDAF6|nr:uncharacterized protein LOC111399999 [Olea europaea var. sylvestris]
MFDSECAGSGHVKTEDGQLVGKHNVAILAVLEPFQSESRMRMLARKLKFANCVSNEQEGGKIWIFWREEFVVDWVGASNQAIHDIFSKGSSTVIISFVYAKCSALERRLLWQELESIMLSSLPWIVAGDFNIIRNDSQRRGGRPRPMVAMDDFNYCIDRYGLIELNAEERKFTWCNGQDGAARSWPRLDRTFTNSMAASLFPNMGLRLLAKETSDQCPLLIHFKQPRVSYGPSPFRFQRIWCEHETFMSCVKEAWVDCNQDVALEGLQKLAGKLKRTKLALKVWNKKVFGRVDHIISELQERVEILEESLQEGFSYDVEQDFLATNIELAEWQKREEIRLSQVAKKRWLRRLAQMMLENGTQLSSPQQIHMEVVRYFQNFLIEEHVGAVPNLSSLIDDTLTDEEGQYLYAMPTENEDIVKKEVVEATQDFLGGGELNRFYTSSYIVLILKVEEPNGFDKFRPISLWSVIYKVFSKIRVSQMAVLLSKIISAEQGAFIAGRNIVENITLTQELVQSMNKKVRGGNVMVKVDMAKAYNRVDWRFLQHGLMIAVCGVSSDGLDDGWMMVDEMEAGNFVMVDLLLVTRLFSSTCLPVMDQPTVRSKSD